MHFLGRRLAVFALALLFCGTLAAVCKWDSVNRKPPQPAPISTIEFRLPGSAEPFLFNTSVKYAQLGATHGHGWEVFLVLNQWGAEQFYQALQQPGLDDPRLPRLVREFNG
mgnify:CR=1 FL=1